VLKRARTEKRKLRSRAAREAAVAQKLEIMRTQDPAGFADMLKLLAKLIVTTRTEKK
jgi:hypothetical protein